MGSLYLLNGYNGYDVGTILRPYLEGGHYWSILAVGKLDLLRRGLTWCHGMSDPGLNLHWNVPLRPAKKMCVHSYYLFLTLSPCPSIIMCTSLSSSHWMRIQRT